MKQAGVALLGCGAIARCHLAALREIPEARVAGVFSRTAERARAAGEEAGCPWTTDAEALLSREDVELAIVTTSSGSHAALARAALEAGKHVLVEKPLAMRASECEELVRLARERGRVLSVVSQRRFEEGHQALKRVLDEGRLGRLLLVEIRCPYHRTQEYYESADWRGTAAADGGALMNQGIHSVDLLLWFAGRPVSVFGRVATLTHEIEVEDLALAVAEFEGGAFGSVMASTSVQPGFPPTLALCGERGTVKFEGSGIAHWSVPGVPAPDLSAVPPTVSGRNPGGVNPRYHVLQIRDVLEAIAAGRPPAIPGEDGLRAVAFVEAVYASSRALRPHSPGIGAAGVLGDILPS